ncbi:hypothetical protein ASPZODRAFT_150195 [Penicilliopsis zonata CBS 506.65]|uniref:HMG box domain-containing protein n=1 Tax=Penicilliopsis zonata CBS 506.65 TaxID=1073090 RepID=A0A1L9SQB8_9EURO|nr:hypothetical protein ASPZODRAFT_150195 [Penicilliopsis zonata CBS 506.65]OJJ49293.1 hypothetical protein ASPZODRAFT_150195 [Penicilliopsis zonata CBS 506.65]
MEAAYSIDKGLPDPLSRQTLSFASRTLAQFNGSATTLLDQPPIFPRVQQHQPPPLVPANPLQSPKGGLEGLQNGHVSLETNEDRGSESTDRLSHELDWDTNYSTPNESATSVSLVSSSIPQQHNKSASPAPALHGSLASRQTPTAAARRPSNSAAIATTTTLDLSRYRPRSSIPSRLSTGMYAHQCIMAAYACRLNPYALHKKEQEALQDHLCHLHVTVYLNIRNGILRLWTRNPMVSVSREEALGCSKDYRWMNLASFAFEWLVRNGYINFGCVEIPLPPVPPKKGRRREGPVIVVIGAGVAGLGCARQLEGLFRHYRDSDTSPRVIVLEGRRRLGGRIYSHPLHSLKSANLPNTLVPKAEMGAQIIVGFDHGNPLDQIVRGQLGLPYHLLRDISTIYDTDGSPVDEVQDAMDERLYNDVLDRSGAYRHKALIVPTAEGDRKLIDAGRDVAVDDGVTVRQYEEARAAGTIGLLFPAKRVRRGVSHKTADLKPTRVPPPTTVADTEEPPAAFTCQAMGWKLNDGITPTDSIDLDSIAKQSVHQTFGAVMDEGFKQYQRLLPLTPKDMRLLNWHLANLEYANAANVGKLSLSGWDQDMGNEFEGEHSQVIGGYQQLPYGLWSLPEKLDVRTNKIVTQISYDPTSSAGRPAVVHCENGETFAADKVILTTSLGVLKRQKIKFQPPLPAWKTGAIDRLGFGVMNKVILVFDKPFWDTQRDMFGLLREPPNKDSMIQEDYAKNRGRFYLFWNCIKTTGLPVLIALMAGDAAHQAETMPDSKIIVEVTAQLRNIFKHVAVPDPLETIITRWASDRFTCGSYSFVAAEALPGDYDLMAQSIGNLHFAGEATCGTHPATVHGAYLSGLRAASEVMESILGPIKLPTPLVLEKGKTFEPPPAPTVSTGQKRKGPPSAEALLGPGLAPSEPAPTPTDPLREAYEKAIQAAIHAELGAPEPRPAKTGLNPFLLYQKDYWHKCKEQSDEAARTATNNPNARAARDEVRHALGQMWRAASEAEKQPYLEQIEVNRQTGAEVEARWKQRTGEWEKRAAEIRRRWCADNPFERWTSPRRR